jgi:hypothetical protein
MWNTSWGKVSTAVGLVSMKMKVPASVGLEWATRRKSWAGKWAALLGGACSELGCMGSWPAGLVWGGN